MNSCDEKHIINVLNTVSQTVLTLSHGSVCCSSNEGSL